MNRAAGAAALGAGRSGHRGSVRVLGRDDLAATIALLSTRPIENVFVGIPSASSTFLRYSTAFVSFPGGFCVSIWMSDR